MRCSVAVTSLRWPLYMAWMLAHYIQRFAREARVMEAVYD